MNEEKGKELWVCLLPRRRVCPLLSVCVFTQLLLTARYEKRNSDVHLF